MILYHHCISNNKYQYKIDNVQDVSLLKSTNLSELQFPILSFECAALYINFWTTELRGVLKIWTD